MVECPNCLSRDVHWRGDYVICNSCKGLGHHMICIYCKHTEVTHYPSHASCSECGWTGDPYDLNETGYDDE